MQRWRNFALSIVIAAAVLQPAVSAPPAQATQAVQPSSAADVSATQVTVRVDSPSAMRALEAEVARTGGTIARRSVDGGSVLVNVPASGDSATYADALAEQVPVRFAEPTALVHAAATPTDPHYGLQWGLPLVGAPAAWDYTWGSPSVIVAVIDSGVDLDHPDLVNQITPGGYDFVYNDGDPSDVFGHGTSVASVVAAQANNGTYGSGMAPGVKILPIRVLADSGSGSAYNVAQGIRYATDRGADVINLSLGTKDPDAELSLAVAYALSHDVVVIAATGNNGTTSVQYPAREPGVIGVGAVDESKNAAAFNDHGFGLDVMAPGNGTLKAGVYVLLNNSVDAAYGKGTSFATPFVSATAALIRSLDPAASVAEISNALLSTAEDRGAIGRDDTFGYGVLRANLAVAAFGPTPTTTLARSALPNAVGWYATAPTITLSADRPASISYRWGSGPVAVYTVGFQPPVGENVLTYWATDAAGTETPKSATFRLDTTAPSVPGGLTAANLTATSVRLSWTAATDAVSDIKEYAVRINAAGVPRGGSTTTTLDIPDLSPGATYSFSVMARDLAGNESAYSDPVSYTVPAATFIPIYRFYNRVNGTHFFTPSAEERAAVIARWSDTFTDEGIAYQVNAANTQPLYRFYNNRSASHFYTASAEEADAVIAKWPTIFTYEGPTYKVSLTGTQADAVYRFYNRANGSHFFTASAEERDAVIARWSNVYLYEGPVFYLGR